MAHMRSPEKHLQAGESHDKRILQYRGVFQHKAVSQGKDVSHDEVCSALKRAVATDQSRIAFSQTIEPFFEWSVVKGPSTE
jgi:hypothetical protein